MKKITYALTLLAFAMAPGFALAGPGGTTCATAEEIFPSQVNAGDTSGAGYGNPVGAVGPLPSPMNDAIYKFTSNGQMTGSISFTGQYPWAIYLTTGCAGTAPSPLEAASGAAGVTGLMPVDNGASGALTAGTTYFVIVSGDPSTGATSNGPFNFTDPSPLPVTLQEFSID